MSKVYFKPVGADAPTDEIRNAAASLLADFLERAGNMMPNIYSKNKRMEKHIPSPFLQSIITITNAGSRLLLHQP